MRNLDQRPKAKTWSGKLLAAIAIVGAVTTGLAVITTNVLSVRDRLSSLFKTATVQTVSVPTEFSFRDARAFEPIIEGEREFYIGVEFSFDKKGDRSFICKGQFLTGGVTYDSDGIFGEAGQKEMRVKMGQVHRIETLRFLVEKSSYSDHAKFRLICEEWPTSWESLSVPPLPPS